MHNDSPATLEREAFLRLSELAMDSGFRESLTPEVARDVANALIQHAVFSQNKGTRDRETSEELVHGLTLFYIAVAEKWVEHAESERAISAAHGLPKKHVLGLDPLVHGEGMVSGYTTFLKEHLDKELEQALEKVRAANGGLFVQGAVGC